ncbi:MAG: glycosyltransferase, partial [Gammaproteobacteria bacterium]
PAPPAGGTQDVVSNFYQSPQHLEHHPHFWYPGDSSDADSIRLDDNIKGLPTYGNSDFGIVKELFSINSRPTEQFDIVHQHGIWMPMSLYSMKIRKQADLKTVIQPHGLLEPFRLNISKYKKKLAFWLFERLNLHNATTLIACSENEALNLKTMFPKHDVAVISNGIDPDFFNAPSLKYSESETKKSILFLSQIIPLKGLERLFRVIADIGIDHFDGWEFIIAGYGDEKYLNLLKRIVSDLNLNSIISFVGKKLGQEKLEVFDNATFFILPTFNENFGIVVAEALARGLPVITTRGTPWEELNKYNCGLCVDNTEDGLKSALLKVLSQSETKIVEMKLNGRRLIAEKYLWDRTTLKTIDLYKWILHGDTKPDFII